MSDREPFIDALKRALADPPPADEQAAPADLDEGALRAALRGEPDPLPPRRATEGFDPTLGDPWAKTATKQADPLAGEVAATLDRTPAKPARSLFDRETEPEAPEAVDRRQPATTPGRRRRAGLVAGLLLVLVAVGGAIAFVLLRDDEPSSDQVATDVTPSAPSTTIRSSTATAEGSDLTQISDDTKQLLQILGVSSAQATGVATTALTDIDQGEPPAPGEPRLDEVGAFVLPLDLETRTGILGPEGTVPCGTTTPDDAAPASSVCSGTTLQSAATSYFVVWAEIGRPFLDPTAAGSGIRASIDVNGDGSIELPVNLSSRGAGVPELVDGVAESATFALVVGNTVALAVPFDGGDPPQWAMASGATTAQITDVIDWQRWYIDPSGDRQAADLIMGADVRDPEAPPDPSTSAPQPSDPSTQPVVHRQPPPSAPIYPTVPAPPTTASIPESTTPSSKATSSTTSQYA